MKAKDITAPNFDEMGEHPIFDPYDLFVDTPMIKSIEATVKRLLWTGEIGCLVRGNSRDGKTRAILELKNRLNDRRGKAVSAHVLSIPRRDQSTVAGLLRRLCLSIGVTPKRAANADEMEDLIFNHFMDEMTAANQSQLVLFVDEMQRLHFSQVDAIASLHDRFAEEKTTLFVLFVGNYGTSDSLVDAIRKDKDKENIAKRFFRHEEIFTGIRFKKDLNHCLRQYDSLRFPVNEGPTYTNFFMESIAPKNWRLESLAATIWDVYQHEFAKPYDISSWGMQYFTASIKTLLTHYLPKYGIGNQSELRDMVFESIKSSSLIEDLVVSV
jgi:hypothetical protein